MCMSERENFHEGHRERMLLKFTGNDNPSNIPDHELLEVLLFYAIPRKDTNVLAHRLLRAFGSLENVLSASVKELSTIDGVGERTALFINVMGKIHNVINENTKKRKNEERFSLGKNLWEFADEFSDVYYEKFLVRLYDLRHREITTLTFEGKEDNFVVADIPEIVKAIAINKPVFVIIAHNHTSGNPMPSDTDDFTTAKINLICKLHGAILSDHLIFAKNSTFSYHGEGRLDKIVDKYSIKKLLHARNED